MAERGIFAGGGDGMTRGGLDRYLGPPAGDYSEMPPSIEDPAEAAADAVPDVDCSDPANAGLAICQIAEAEKEHDAEEPKV